MFLFPTPAGPKMPNDYSPVWFATFLDTMPPEWTAAEIAFLTRWLPDPPFHRLLDLCCGSGRHSRPLAAQGYAVTGVDINAEALAQARALAGAGEHYVQLDMREVARLDGTFDAALNLWQSFGNFDEATNADILRQIATKLRPGGRFILDIYHRGFMEQHLEPQRYERNGREVVSTRRLDGHRFTSAIDYGPDLPRDVFTWQLYTPDEISAVVRPFGFVPLVICAWWDEQRPASADDARMQLVFQLQNN